MIKFNVPAYTGDEDKYIRQVLDGRHYCGEGVMTRQCETIFEERFKTPKALLTPSCSAALDMAALLCDIKPDEEVILPSYTFSTTASSFALRGARLVFVDIRPDTMNIDEKLIEAAITPKTRAISVVHYAGVACEMDTIMDIANRHHLLVVEDAAQGVMSTYKGQALGTIGDFGCYSFHDTKNYNMGEGGALLIKDRRYFDKADNIWDCGNNKKSFRAGKVSEYSWHDIGSSYLPSELNAAFLRGQLDNLDRINEDRLASWHSYYQLLKPLQEQAYIELPCIPDACIHNAHMFYIKTRTAAERNELMAFLKEREIYTASHYVPLHSSGAGRKCGIFYGTDKYTTKDSYRLLRLPMYYCLSKADILKVVNAIRNFYESR